MVCHMVYINVWLHQQMTKKKKKITIIAAKIENCCYFCQIPSEKHELNFCKELILQYTEVFYLNFMVT